MPTTAGKKRLSRAGQDLSSISASELQAEIARRKKRVQALVRRHDALVTKTEALRAEIAALGVNAAASGAGMRGALTTVRTRNASNLLDSLKQVMGKKIMTVKEAAEKVVAAGYQTTSPSFRLIVNATFIRSGAFERVERGKYKVKDSSA